MLTGDWYWWKTERRSSTFQKEYEPVTIVTKAFSTFPSGPSNLADVSMKDREFSRANSRATSVETCLWSSKSDLFPTSIYFSGKILVRSKEGETSLFKKVISWAWNAIWSWKMKPKVSVQLKLLHPQRRRAPLTTWRRVRTSLSSWYRKLKFWAFNG